MPSYLFSPVHVHVSPFSIPILISWRPPLSNLSSVYVFLSASYPKMDRAVPVPPNSGGREKSEWLTRKKAPFIHSPLPLAVNFTPAPHGPAAMAASLL